MKKIFSIFLMLVALVASAQEIKWMSMNDALAAQKKTPKKILMYTLHGVVLVDCSLKKLSRTKTWSNTSMIISML